MYRKGAWLPSPPAPVTVELDLTGYSGREPLPDGTYRAEASAEDLVAAGADQFYAAINAGTWTLSVEGDEWQAEHQGRNEVCSGSHRSWVRMSACSRSSPRAAAWTTTSAGASMEALSLRLAHFPHSHTAADFANEQTFMDRVWTRIAGPMASGAPTASMPPDGVYRTEITVEDLEARGIDHESAVGNAGIVTLTIGSAQGLIVLESGEAAGNICQLTVNPTPDVVRLVLSGGDCDPGEYQLTFAVEGDRLIPSRSSRPSLPRTFERPGRSSSGTGRASRTAQARGKQSRVPRLRQRRI